MMGDPIQANPVTPRVPAPTQTPTGGRSTGARGAAGGAATQGDPAAPERKRYYAPPDPSPCLSDLMLAGAERNRYWLFLGLFVVYAIGFTPQWRLEPDSALYLCIGRNLATGAGYTFQGRPHHLVYPGVPLLFAGIFKLFHSGRDSINLLPHVIVMPLLGFATLALVYRLFLLFADRPTAVMITVGVGMTRLFYRYSFELLSDLPFLLGVMMFLVGHEGVFCRARRDARRRRRHAADDAPPAADDGPARATSSACRPHWYDYALLIGGLAVAVSTRPAMWALVFAAIGAAAWSLVRGALRWSHVAAVLAVVAAVALFYWELDPRHKTAPVEPGAPTYVEEDQMFQLRPGRITAMADNAIHNLRPLLGRQAAKAIFGLPLTEPGGLLFDTIVIALGIGLLRFRPLWGMFVLATVLICLLVPDPHERYLLPVLPLLVYAWWRALVWLNHRLPVCWRNRAFAALFLLGVLPNGAMMINFMIEQRHMPFLTYYKEGRYASVYQVGKMLKHTLPPSGDPHAPTTTWVLVPSKFARILTLLSGRYAIEPGLHSSLHPEQDVGWQSFYVLQTSDMKKQDVESKQMTIPEWLSLRGVAIVPTPIAQCPNACPMATEPWRLHQVQPLAPKAPTSAAPPQARINAGR